MKKLFSFFLWSLFCLPAFCQNTIALPKIVNYSKNEYKGGTQNWGICQDKNGLVYFANNEGLLSFDGTYWRLYPLPNKTIVRSVAIGADDKIYVGGQDELGYFSPDNTGELVYHSLTALIPETYRSFSDVWNIYSINKQIFFRASQRIFLYANNKIAVYPADEWVFMGLSHKGIIAQKKNNDVIGFEKDTWSALLKGALPKDCMITAAIVVGKDSTIITTLKNGIYLFAGDACVKMDFPLSNKMAMQHVYAAARIDDEHIALSVNMKGCFIINKKGGQVQQFSYRDGLQGNNILSIFTDRDKNIWLGLSNGIDLVCYNSPVKNITPDKLNEGSGYSSIIHDKKLYVSTVNGLYAAPISSTETTDLSFQRSEFTPVQNANGEAWNISVVNDQLLMGHHEGAFLVENNKAVPLAQSPGYWNFFPLSQVPPAEMMVAGTYKGLKFFSWQQGHFSLAGFDAPFESARFVVVKDDDIWVSHPYKGIYRISSISNNKPAIEFYGENHGISTSSNYIYNIKNRLIAATEKGIYEYNTQADKFEPSSFFQNIFGSKFVYYLKEDPSGNVWFVFDKKLGVVDFSNAKPQTIYINELNNKLVNGFEHVYPVDDNNIFVGGEKGLFHINYNKYKQQKNPLHIQFTQVQITGVSDSLLFRGYFKEINQPQVQSTIPNVRYQWNNFRFAYSCPSYEEQPNIQYSYFLEGYENRWSDWSEKTEKEYANLPAGKYSFIVKAKDNLGNESPVSDFTFVILPPWYQTWWAYCLYVFLIACVLFLVYRWQKRKFVVQQERYEEKQKRLLDAHQFELEKSEKEIVQLRNEKLEAEIHHKNKEMNSATMHLVKKGELITKINDELHRLSRTLKDDESLAAIKKITKALDEDDSIDKDWEHFTAHFDKAHNDFFISLKGQHPNLSPNELKLCAYLRMNLTTKEIAQLMNISVRGVEVSRYRLRKKLQIPTETNLFNYLLDFHSNGTI